MLWFRSKRFVSLARLLTCAYLSVIIGVLLGGCQRTANPKLILGTWQFDAGSQSAKWTYFNDHTWRLSVSGATNGMLAGDWALRGNQLITTTRHSTLAQAPLSVGETVILVRLTPFVMEVKSANNPGSNILLQRINSDAAELRQKVSGTWTSDVTNKSNGMTAHTSSTYQTGGKAIWSGTVTAGSKTLKIEKTGEWWVEHGYLCTVVTNPLSVSASEIERVCRDEIVEVSSDQFSFRDSEGRLQATTRNPSR